MKYSINVTKRVMKTITMEMPDHIPMDAAREFAEEVVDDIFDIEPYQGTVEWNEFFGEPVKVRLTSSDGSDEFDIDGFGLAEN